MSDQTTEPTKMPWADWSAALVKIAADWDVGNIDPEDFRDYYDDDYSAEDAWTEDCEYGL